jgi:hypothetical protein
MSPLAATVEHPEIEISDELHLKVDVVRVDDHDAGDTVVFAISTASNATVRITIRQDDGGIVEVRKAPTDRGRYKPLFDEPD